MILLSVTQTNPNFPTICIRIKDGVICNYRKFYEIVTNSYSHYQLSYLSDSLYWAVHVIEQLRVKVTWKNSLSIGKKEDLIEECQPLFAPSIEEKWTLSQNANCGHVLQFSFRGHEAVDWIKKELPNPLSLTFNKSALCPNEKCQTSSLLSWGK